MVRFISKSIPRRVRSGWSSAWRTRGRGSHASTTSCPAGTRRRTAWASASSARRGSRRMERFAIESGPSGTRVRLEKDFPSRVPLATARRVDEIVTAVGQLRPQGLIEEIQQQNQELLRALDELQRK